MIIILTQCFPPRVGGIENLIETSLLNSNDLKWLNSYHQTVFDKLSIFLTAEEKLWLQNVTSPL